jgi:hypothetical protein
MMPAPFLREERSGGDQKIRMRMRTRRIRPPTPIYMTHLLGWVGLPGC